MNDTHQFTFVCKTKTSKVEIKAPVSTDNWLPRHGSVGQMRARTRGGQGSVALKLAGSKPRRNRPVKVSQVSHANWLGKKCSSSSCWRSNATQVDDFCIWTQIDDWRMFRTVAEKKEKHILKARWFGDPTCYLIWFNANNPWNQKSTKLSSQELDCAV